MTKDNQLPEFLYLEQIEDPEALRWVDFQTKKTQNHFSKNQLFLDLKDDTKQVLYNKERLLEVRLEGGWVYNLWQDQNQVQGLLRRCTQKDYQSGTFEWETLLDLDQLSRSKQKTYVLKDFRVSFKSERALLFLSEGGSDASQIFEFDFISKTFVDQNGFYLPASKSFADWYDQDTLLLSSAIEEGDKTESGYSQKVYLWKRGHHFKKDPPLFECPKNSMSLYGLMDIDGSIPYWYIIHRLNFFEEECYLILSDRKVQKIHLPRETSIQAMTKDYWVGISRKPFGAHIFENSIIAVHKDAQSADQVIVLYSPKNGKSVQSCTVGNSCIYVELLNHVRSQIIALDTQNGIHAQLPILELQYPSDGVLSLTAFDREFDSAYVRYHSLLKPPTQYFQIRDQQNNVGMIKVAQSPDLFEVKGLELKQHFAQSQDGTQIPYFIVHKKDLELDGSTPTLMYGYGGFEFSILPEYRAITGKLWLERGGAFVIANIRGGSEYGSNWHQSALKQNRQKCFDDFIAVAQDLITKKITSPKKLGIFGGSNGGLLTGAVFTQKPELFGAVAILVPLLDMLRYHLLLAGASWVAEYGDPGNPQMAEAILKYSPMQNLKKNQAYPTPLIYTSRKDDRVHPGHARRFAAKLEDLGYDFYYYENPQGGHAGAANLLEQETQNALIYSYFWEKLGDN